MPAIIPDVRSLGGYYSLRRLDKPASGLTFAVSPQQVQIEVPARVNVYPSVGKKTFLDHLGPGVGTIRIVGHTGRHPTLTGSDGYHTYYLLREVVDTFNHDWTVEVSDVPAKRPALHLTIDAPQKFGVWSVAVENLLLLRDVQHPLLFSYDLRLIVLEEIDGLYPVYPRRPPAIIDSGARFREAREALEAERQRAKTAGSASTDGGPPSEQEDLSYLLDVDYTGSQIYLAQVAAKLFGLVPENVPQRYVAFDYDPAVNGTVADIAHEWYGDNDELYLPIIYLANAINRTDSLGAQRLHMPVGFWV